MNLPQIQGSHRELSSVASVNLWECACSSCSRDSRCAVEFSSSANVFWEFRRARVPEQRCYLASSNCGFLRRRFMSTTSLRMQATSATFGFLPAARSFK